MFTLLRIEYNLLKLVWMKKHFPFVLLLAQLTHTNLRLPAFQNLGSYHQINYFSIQKFIFKALKEEGLLLELSFKKYHASQCLVQDFIWSS